MSRTSIIALVVFLALAVLVLVTMRTRSAQKLQAGALQLVRPLHTTTSGVGRSLGAFGAGLKSLDELESENKVLTIENQKLRTHNQLLDNLENENNSLRQALDFKKRSQFNLLPARIIARSATAWWSNVQIDRGEQDGLDSDMPVVTDVGLVGKTTTVSATTAYVLLITDENCQVAAYVEGTKEKGIVRGERVGVNAQPNLNLNYLSKGADLHPGQKVFSSGVSGGVFPYNLLLGTISNFEVRDLAAHATVAPAVDVAKLENVFVVLPEHKGAASTGEKRASTNDDQPAGTAVPRATMPPAPGEKRVSLAADKPANSTGKAPTLSATPSATVVKSAKVAAATPASSPRTAATAAIKPGNREEASRAGASPGGFGFRGRSAAAPSPSPTPGKVARQ